MEKVNILGVNIDNVTMKQAVDKVLKMTDSVGAKMVFTPNSEIIEMATKDKELFKILNEADLLTPDGIGVIYASKIIGKPLKEKVAGCELAENIFKKVSDTNKTLFFLGGKPGVAQTAYENLIKKYKNLKIVGTNDGYFTNDDEIIEKISQKSPDILFVCLGVPKQEKWIYKNKGKLNCKVLMGLGGSLDLFAGKAKRAPDIFIRLGLEWFYRLICEPTRYKRMARLPIFALKVIFKKG